MFILLGFILQAVSYEFRKKPNNFLGPKVYEIFLFINGLLATVLIGTAVGTFFTGSPFVVDKFNLSSWMVSSHGLEAALNIQNLSLGLAVFFLTRMTGSMFFITAIDHDAINKRSVKQILINGLVFLVFFLMFIGLLLTKKRICS